jgi:hypothetical protein
MLDFSPVESARIATALLREPNKALSSKRELRFGTHGSMSVDLTKGLYFDHENSEGGSLFQLIRREKGNCERCVRAAASGSRVLGLARAYRPSPRRPRSSRSFAAMRISAFLTMLSRRICARLRIFGLARLSVEFVKLIAMFNEPIDFGLEQF